MHQRWAGLLFLHWRVNPAVIQARLPDGLYVDTYGGSAWLGVVPFFMERVRPVYLPALPRLSWFLELNVRTYVYDTQGRPGVWFFSLDCNQPIAVEIARRMFHLPYEHATMKIKREQESITYHCHRKGSNTSPADFKYIMPAVANPAIENTLEWFLVERYLLFSKRPDGHLYCGRVHHRPYQIAQADGAQWSAEPLKWDGFMMPEDPPTSMSVANPVKVKVYPLQQI
jgi:uncharacterized protein YqjF (DUF2071 family)